MIVMNRRHFFLGLILLISAILFSCKKDYPSDIPQWLKEKIRVYKEDDSKAYYSAPKSIVEYKSNTEIVYVFHNQELIFNYDGKRLYEDGDGNLHEHEVYSGPHALILNGYTPTRIIWICRACWN